MPKMQTVTLYIICFPTELKNIDLDLVHQRPFKPKINFMVRFQEQLSSLVQIPKIYNRIQHNYK